MKQKTNSSHLITPLAAAAICFNTMIGAGLFINPGPLTALAGPLGVLGYIFSMILLIPIIFSLAHLAEKNPVSGGLYVYSKLYVHPFAGFLSGWGYFVGKTTSAAILMHSFVLFTQRSFPQIAHIPTLYLDYLFIFALIFLNIGGMRIGGRMQIFFTFLKVIPLVFGILFGVLACDPYNFFVTLHDVTGSFYTIPVALFASLGFEIICSIGHLIKDPEKNSKRVIITTFFFVMIFNILFQLALFSALGMSLAGAMTPLLLLAQVWQAPYNALLIMFNSFVFCAIIGSCFSIFTSNSWNLYTLADNNHLPGKQYLTHLNRFNVPWVSLITEGILACLVLSLNAPQVPMQNMAVFGQIVAHCFTALAAFKAVRLGILSRLPAAVPLTGLAGCCGILFLCASRMIQAGISTAYLLIFMCGILSYFLMSRLAE